MIEKLELTGKKILDVHVRYEGFLVDFPISVGKEITPPDESTMTFTGFPTVFHALTEASQLDRIGLIVQFFGQPETTPKITGSHGISLLGRFHVFSSSHKRHKVGPNYESISMAPQYSAFLSIRNTHMVKPDIKKSWMDRRAEASKSEHYVGMIKDFMSLVPQELNIAYKNENYKSSVINFNPGLEEKGEAGLLVELPCKDGDDPLFDPEPVMAIGPKSFVSSSPVYTMMTIVHEATHFSQAVRSLALVNLWRETKSTDFSKWLKSLWKHKEISFEDYQVAKESCGRGKSTKQVLASLEGFMIGYHHIPMADIENSSLPWDQLSVISDYWRPVVPVGIKSLVTKRLVSYYKSLDNDRQTALKAVLEKAANEDKDLFSEELLIKIP